MQENNSGCFFSEQCNATSNNTKLVDWPLIGGLLHLVQRGAAWASGGSTVLLYDGLLLCGFNVAIKKLIYNVFPVQPLNMSRG